MTMSQSHIGSVNASQSVASTPRATPPKGSQKSSMSFSFQNGMSHHSNARGSFGRYDEPNGYGHTMSYQEDYKPQIYRVFISPIDFFAD